MTQPLSGISPHVDSVVIFEYFLNKNANIVKEAFGGEFVCVGRNLDILCENKVLASVLQEKEMNHWTNTHHPYKGAKHIWAEWQINHHRDEEMLN